MVQRIQTNTNIYSLVWPNLPSDKYATFAAQDAALAYVPENVDLLQQVQGHYIIFPAYFLRDEPLWPDHYNSLPSSLLVTFV
jgi:hypothetical protein